MATLSNKRRNQLRAAKRKWTSSHTHQVNIMYRTSDYDVVKAAADLMNLPVATFIREAVDAYIDQLGLEVSEVEVSDEGDD